MGNLLSLFQRKKGAEPICSVIVVAAGSARRMEGIDKILTKLGELPVLIHTLYAFQDCPMISEVIVVTREDLIVTAGDLCRQFGMSKVKAIVKGGEERINSVQAGLAQVRPDADLIAIHDGARPLLPQKVLQDVLKKAQITGAAAPALPMTDTIKRTEKGVAVETLDRTTLFAVQTPQVFEAGLIQAAIQKAIQDGAALTDDCAAVERMGMKVSLTEGSRENLKLTTPFDLIVAEGILEARGRGVL